LIIENETGATGFGAPLLRGEMADADMKSNCTTAHVCHAL
jgi:hypothetical protein